jgi:hypothetical protein
MNPSIKEQVTPHFSQVKAEGATRVKRIREVTTQAGTEAIAEVKAGYQSIQGIFKEVLQVLKTTAIQNLEEAKAKGTSTAHALAKEQVIKAKTQIENLDTQWTERHGSSYIGFKQRLQNARTWYTETRQHMQTVQPSPYQTVQGDVENQVEQTATKVVRREEQVKQYLKTAIQSVAKQ